MQVESSAAPLLTVDEVEKDQVQIIASFIGHVFQLTYVLLLTNSFNKKNLIAEFARKIIFFQFACLTKISVTNKTQTQNGAQTFYSSLDWQLQNSVFCMKLIYLDVLLHAPLTSRSLHLTYSISHASFVFS